MLILLGQTIPCIRVAQLSIHPTPMGGVVGTITISVEVGDDMESWYARRVIIGSRASSAEYAVK